MNTYNTDPVYPAHAAYEQAPPYNPQPIEPAPPAVSAVSWAAVLAGAVAAAALSLILLILGTGLGMSAVSPWSYEGMGAQALGISTIVWLAVMQLLASGLGGYLAGRLRTRWMDAARDEVFFRDTAHGFLSWSVATLLTATVLASTVSAIVGAGVQAGASVVGGAASSAAMAVGGTLAGRNAARGDDLGGDTNAINYWVDTLLRNTGDRATTGPAASGTPAAPGTPDNASGSAAGTTVTPSAQTPSAAADSTGTNASLPVPPGQSAAQDSAEVARILLNADLSQPLPPEDLRRIGQIVAQRSGISQQAAEQRVSQNYAQLQSRLQQAEDQTRATADQARKTTAKSALWLFVSLLLGAFVASLAATLGGRQRDA